MREEQDPRQPSDEDFMRSLCQEYQRLMYYTAHKYQADFSQCEDIVQDSLEKLTGKVTLLKRLSKPSLVSYIVVTTRNTAINHLKQEQREKEYVVSLDEIQENTRSTDQTVDEKLILEEALSQMRTVWPRLSPETRQILEAKYILGYTDREIADALGCRPASVRMKLTRAKRQVLKHLTGKERGPLR